MGIESNPFYVRPAQSDISPFLKGIGSLIKQNREEKQQKENSDALMKAYGSNDPGKVAELTANNPELGKTLSSMMGYKNEVTEKNWADTVRAVAMTQDPEQRKRIIADRVQFVLDNGGKPLQSLMVLNEITDNPEAFENALSLQIALTQPKSFYEEWKRQSGVDSNEADWPNAKTFAVGAGKGLQQRAVLNEDGSLRTLGEPYTPRNPFLDVGTEFVNPNDPTAKVRKNLALAEFRKKEGVAAQKRMSAFPVSIDKAEAGLQQIDFLNEELDTLANTATGLTTGWGSLLKDLPATKAAEWQSIKTGVLSGLGIDTITELKTQSSTGATGFGALNAQELELLTSYRGKLEQATDAKSIRRIIGRMQKLLSNSRTRISTRIKKEQEWFDKKSNEYGYDPVAVRDLPQNLEPPLPEGVTEADITKTMSENGMTREQVMDRLNAR